MEGLESALMDRVPEGTQELNLKALRAGIEAAKKLDLCALPQFVGDGDDAVQN